MTRTKKTIIGIGIVAAAIVISLFVFLYSISHRGVPVYDGTVALKGLSQPVTVYRDNYAVPHIYAKTDADLYRAVGYVMAQDRLWQMDLLRRVTQGRLSEIFGKDLVEADVLFRSLRIRVNSELVMAELTPAEKESLEAFADGVNQFIDQAGSSLPVEFTILKYRPEKWEPISSLDLIGYMSWDLNSGWNEDLMLYQVREKAGKDLYREIVPENSGRAAIFPAIAADIIPEFIASARRIAAAGDRVAGLGLAVFGASNNWAVSGKRSATGKAILANDMHLGLNVPGIWMQMHQVVEGGLNVTGVVLPGQPLVISGHNSDIAWGLTNVGADNLDFYLEKVNASDPGKYLFRGRWLPFETRRELIRIKGGETVEKSVRYTVHGPVVADIKNTGGLVISMKWLGNVKSNELRAVTLLNRARNWNDFRTATSHFSAVGQNIAYADTKGNIGLQCSTGIPLRAGGKGDDILPGWTGDHEWTGKVPFEQLPSLYNPASGFVSSANNRTVTKSRYYISTWGFSTADRFDRINELIQSKNGITVDDFCAMQLDVTSPLSRLLKKDIPATLKGNPALTDREKAIVTMVETWDGALTADSAPGALCEAFYLAMIKNTFADELGPELFKDFIKPRSVSLHALGTIWKTDSRWFDMTGTKDVTEKFADVVLASFREAVRELDGKLGPDPLKWKWGKLHTLTLQHPLGKVKILDLAFGLNKGPYALGGSHHTIPQFAYKFAEPYAIVHGPSQRHVYDLSDWNRSKSVIPTGNCGVPAGRHYGDQSGIYASGRFHDDVVSPEEVKKSAVYTLTLRRAD